MTTQTTTADVAVRTFKYLGATVSIEQFTALQAEARAEHRSVSSQLRVILSERYGVDGGKR